MTDLDKVIVCICILAIIIALTSIGNALHRIADAMYYLAFHKDKKQVSDKKDAKP